MKKVFITLTVILFASISQAQNVGIGTTTPNGSALLDLNSTSKGLLPPRMLSSQRDAITAPVAGLIVWCSDCGPSGEMQLFNGSTWTNMVGSPATNGGEITIGTQVWKAKNLDVTTYRDGTPIPKVTDPAVWAALTTGAYCYYNNDSATYAATYGKLYNYYAVVDSRGLAPVGYHIANSTEWSTLSTYLGGDAAAGGKLKEAGLTHWVSPNNLATNSSGFTGLPCGYRFSDGTFNTLTTYGYYWTSTESNATQAWYRVTRYSQGDFNLNYTNKQTGFSIRCIKD